MIKLTFSLKRKKLIAFFVISANGKIWTCCLETKFRESLPTFNDLFGDVSVRIAAISVGVEYPKRKKTAKKPNLRS